jgi:hypothetical protein
MLTKCPSKIADQTIFEILLREINNYGSANFVGYEVLCALCYASVNSLSVQIPSNLLIALVENRLWTPTQGLLYARRVPGSPESIMTLCKIASFFEEPEKTDIIKDVLEKARGIEDETWRIDALINILPYLPENLMISRIDEIFDIDKNKEFLDVDRLVIIASYCSDPKKSEIIGSLQNEAREEDIMSDNVEYFAEIVPFLSEPQKTNILDKVIAIFMQYDFSVYEIDPLIKLIPILSEPQKKDILNDVLAIIWDEESDFVKDGLIIKVIPYLTEPKETFTLAEEIRDPVLRSQALADIACLLSEQEKIRILKKAYAITREISDEANIASLLARIMPYLSEPVKEKVFKEALNLARNIEEERIRAGNLAQISFSASEPQKDQLIRESLSLARSVKDDFSRGCAIKDVLTFSTPNQDPITLAKEIVNVFDRADTLSNISSFYPEPLRTEILEEALIIIREDDSDWHKAIHLGRIIPYLPELQKNEEDFEYRLICNL